jgi:ribosomal-protein-alanine N-acetyltransferase
MLRLVFSPFPFLKTEQLILRQLTINDANDILKLRSDKKVNEFIDRPKTIDLTSARKFIEKIDKGIKENEWIYWAISLKGNDTLIGTICFWNIVPEKDMAETGYELFPEFQGKGLMQEAFAQIIDFGFHKMNLKIITAFTHPDNDRSKRLLEKNNFQQDKDHRFASKEDAIDQSVYYLQQPF